MVRVVVHATSLLLIRGTSLAPQRDIEPRRPVDRRTHHDISAVRLLLLGKRIGDPAAEDERQQDLGLQSGAVRRRFTAIHAEASVAAVSAGSCSRLRILITCGAGGDGHIRQAISMFATAKLRLERRCANVP